MIQAGVFLLKHLQLKVFLAENIYSLSPLDKAYYPSSSSPFSFEVFYFAFLFLLFMGNVRALVKNSIKESFDITFMGNEKSYQNINCFFFPHKNFI